MSNLNILIVEDESLLALDLATSIKSYGYNAVMYATKVTSAKKIISENNIDIIIMDINLNDKINGIELYKSLDTDADIIYLTAYSDDKTIEQLVETLPLGFLIKPHNEKELFMLLKLAEMKNSSATQKSSLIKIGSGYEFDINEDKVYKNNTFIKLSKKETTLLKLLLNARGNVVTFTEIENELWDSPPSESSLRTLIYRLRGKLEHKFIKNELKHGIKLEV